MSASTKKKLRRAEREAGIDKKAEAAKAAAEKKAKTNRRWSLVAAGVAVLVIVAIVLGTSIPFMATAYTVGNEKFSAAEVNYQYGAQYSSFVNQYGSYASLFGLDTSTGVVGLGDQLCYMTDDGGSWRDYFLNAAKEAMIQSTALNDYAAANGIVLTEDEKAGVEGYFYGINELAYTYGYANADQFFSASYGNGVDFDMVLDGYMDSALCSKVVEQVTDSYSYTEAELEEQYQSYEGAQDILNYVYYFVAAETEGEDATVTEAALAAAKAKADDIVKAYKAAKGDDAAAKFDEALASVVPEAAATEQNIAGSSIIAASEWMLDAKRANGDITSEVNSSETGYYVVVFLNRDDNHYNMANVRHILVKAVANENGEYTEEAKQTAKAHAEDLLKEFLAGDKSEESFAAMANQYSEDGGSNTIGGLYENIAKGQMVEEFEQFCFEGHKPGDTAVVYGESSAYAGYHVMYYVGEGMQYSDYIADTELRSADLYAWLAEIMADYKVSEGFGMRLVG